MPRFAANLSMLYNEYEFLDRFAAAAQDGFKAVEFLFPYAFAAQEINQRLNDEGLKQVLFNAPPGNWDAGERGIACIAGREKEFQTGFLQALEYADRLQCPNIHVMAGIKPNHATPELLVETYCANLKWAAEQAAHMHCNVLIEPINVRDMPGYFLNYQAQAHDLVERLGLPNIKVQMDLYHCQIMEGDLEMQIRKYLPTARVGHFQIAGVPLRHEPDQGEVCFDHLFDVIDQVSQACGWHGWVGCEYRPARGVQSNATREGLTWFKQRG
jgi:hydroxypyruvate isomerase